MRLIHHSLRNVTLFHLQDRNIIITQSVEQALNLYHQSCSNYVSK